MKLYAERGGLRARQIVLDLAVLAWIVVWVWAGAHVDQQVNRLAGPGRTVESAGHRLAGASAKVSGAAKRVPGLGSTLAKPFSAVQDSGRQLESAGVTQQRETHRLALLLGWLIAVLPIAYALIHHLPGRIRWARQASAGARLRAAGADRRLFALRALATAPLTDLAGVTTDPMAAYDAGRVDALADLEFRRLGLVAS
jgi:hypothetical protein